MPEIDPLTTYSSCCLRVDDADVPTSTDYGMREFALVDRSGNLIRVGSPS